MTTERIRPQDLNPGDRYRMVATVAEEHPNKVARTFTQTVTRVEPSEDEPGAYKVYYEGPIDPDDKEYYSVIPAGYVVERIT
ncbi:hypothetical protein AB0M13_27305 [Nocardia fluminea]|uniref:hypothetical protein n=1 Tax=Nocardia fluminea TaxID=134984 RepID=UPI00341C87C9